MPSQPSTQPTFREPRKITLEILVDQQSKDWHWIYDSMHDLNLLNGMKVCGVSDEWQTQADEENE